MGTQEKKASVWSTGLAMFSMFFGAGNIVFPLAIGQLTQSKNVFAVLGLVITAVLVPLAGLLAMLLYKGDYLSFFRRMGKWPGFAVVVMILALIGPFAGIPRCITISYSTLHACGLGWMNLTVFSVLSCIVVFFCTYRPTKIMTLLGYVLTPILLLSLGVIVFKGLFSMPTAPHAEAGRWETFSTGLVSGYNTMDLLAAFFFSSCVLLCLRKGKGSDEKRNFSLALKGSFIAAILLSAVYVSFSFLAAGYSSSLESVPPHMMLGTLAHQMLGPSAGLVAGIAVSFACLTTEIALTAVFADFLRTTIFRERISYPSAIGLTLFVTFFVSTLHFNGISAFLAPILQVCYPALIVLTFLNILHKRKDFKPVKSFVYTIFLASFLLYIF